jgi:hypothetical protein
MAANLGKPRRQHWDIAMIKTPPESRVSDRALSYGYLKLTAAVEFGMNEAEEHLIEDIERLCHPDSNVEQGFIIHLYRLSRPGGRCSNRDWSSRSRLILSKEDVAELARNQPVGVYCGIHDGAGKCASGAWPLNHGEIDSLRQAQQQDDQEAELRPVLLPDRSGTDSRKDRDAAQAT